MKDCCVHDNKDTECVRKKDKKTFRLPRKFSRKKCRNPRGFSMKSSCAPYNGCYLPRLRNVGKKTKKHKYKLKNPQSKRILAIEEGISYEKKQGKTTKQAALSKKKRFNVLRIYRKNRDPDGCRKLTKDMEYIDKKYNLGKTNDICEKSQSGGRSQTYMYNSDDPKNSFDVYIDKNPKDTISIKYKELKDVKDTIIKLERLYKKGKYTHKRITQVAKIMYLRLRVLKKTKKEQFDLSERYFEHLKKRTLLKGFSKRKKFTFAL